jgi:hypothetical protein
VLGSQEEGGGGCSGGVGFWVSPFFPSWHTCVHVMREKMKRTFVVFRAFAVFFWWLVASTTSVGPECNASNSFSCWKKA